MVAEKEQFILKSNKTKKIWKKRKTQYFPIWKALEKN